LNIILVNIKINFFIIKFYISTFWFWLLLNIKKTNFDNYL